MLDPDKFKVPPYIAHAMDLAPMSPEETATFQEIVNKHAIKADDPMIQNVFEDVRKHMAEGADQATIVIDSVPNNQVLVGGLSPAQNGISLNRLKEMAMNQGPEMTLDESEQVARSARRGGKGALLIAQMAAMSMAMMPDLFRAGTATGTTRANVGGFFGGTDPQRRAYDVHEESQRLAKQIDDAEKAEVAMDKAEAKRQRRMERNLKNVQRNS